MGKYVKMHAMETKPLRQHFPGRSPPNACDEDTTLFLFPGRSPTGPVPTPFRRQQGGNGGVRDRRQPPAGGRPQVRQVGRGPSPACLSLEGGRGASNRSARRVTYSVLPSHSCSASNYTESPRLRKANSFSYHDVSFFGVSSQLGSALPEVFIPRKT